MEPVAVIEADKLLEWLREQMKQAQHISESTLLEETRKFYCAYVTAYQEVISHVDFEKYLVDKESKND